MCFVNVAFFASIRHKHVVTPVVETIQGPVPIEPETPKQKVEAVPQFVEIPVFRKSENSVYGDVISHSQEKPFGDHAGRSTNAHETGHGIHSYLRNKYSSELNKKVNGFYCLQGRGSIVEEPKIRKNQVKRFVPASLRGYRYPLYLERQKEWDDTPLYIYDEWNAYVLGGKCCVDDMQNNKYTGGNVDGVSGCLEFSIYSTALCMAVKEYDPSYWENNKQFRDFTIWNLRESYKTFMVGRVMDKFKWDKQDAMLKSLLTSSDAEPMRNFLKENLEGVWLDANEEDIKATYRPEQCKLFTIDEYGHRDLTKFRP